MRIPDISFFDTFIKYDRIREKDIEKYTRQLASGKKILSPSDNTVDNVRSLRFKKLIENIDTYNRNIDRVKTQLDVAESTLANIIEAARETKVEIIRLHNVGVLDAEDAEILKDFFKSMRDYILDQANVQVGDSRLFGGVKSQTDPFASDGTYVGELVETTVPVSKGVELNTTFNGKEYLGVNETSNKMLIVEVIDKIIDIIDSGDLSRLYNPADYINVQIDGNSYGNVSVIEAFDIGLNEILQRRSMLGEQIRIADNLKQQNETLRVNFSELVSKLEDADFAGTISELEKARTAYEATIASIMQNKDLSLLKFYK